MDRKEETESVEYKFKDNKAKLDIFYLIAASFIENVKFYNHVEFMISKGITYKSFFDNVFFIYIIIEFFIFLSFIG